MFGKKPHWAAWTVATVLALSGAYGTDYFVDPVAGDNNYDGLCQISNGQGCGPKRTIAAAMNFAVNGDVVILSEGIYTGDGNRDLDYAGKAITVRSTNPDDPAIIAATAIDIQASSEDKHRAFKFITGEGEKSVLAGLTIVNGWAPTGYDTGGSGVGYAGGGVLCTGSSPTIRDCVISNCTANDGGAIYAKLGDGPRLIHCRLTENFACTNACGKSFVSGGSGIDCQETADAIFVDCEISDNLADQQMLGIGIQCSNGSVTMLGCTVARNRRMNGGAIQQGGGLFSQGAAVTMSDCVFEDNGFDLNGSSVSGGAIYFSANAPLMIENCAFRGNSASQGGVIRAISSQITMRNCSIVGNSASQRIIRISSSGVMPHEIDNCTFADNVFSTTSYLITTVGPLHARNSVFWNNGAQFVPGESVSAEYSDIRGGWTGTGNIDADPLFVDAANGDYHLAAGSPCINAGDPATTGAGETDIDGQTRVWAGRVDMGADETGSFSFGDLNCDGSVNPFDVQAFLTALISAQNYAAQYPDCSRSLADMNLNGSVNAFDIQSFVDLLEP